MPSREATFAEPCIELIRYDGDRTVLRSREGLAAHPVSVVHAFRAGSEAHPERDLLVERGPDGAWEHSTWGAIREAVDRTAAGLLEHGLSERPVMVLSGNSRSHLVVMLAALTIGTPVAPVSVAYSLRSRDHTTLRSVVELVDPVAVVAESEAFTPAVAAVAGGRVVLGRGPGATPVEDLAVAPSEHVERRCATLCPDTVAKVLFTSGSTGTPKGVVNTHGMLAANQQQIRQVWPFLDLEPPALLDWLPWSHTFGGNHNLNMVLARGGTLWIDDGRPTPDLVGRTVDNLVEARPTVYATVPAGYEALLPWLERDHDAARAALSRLRVGFFAAAALPQRTWDRILALAARHGSPMTMTTSWGMTETGPAAMSAHFALERSDCLGVPLPGVEVALEPRGAKHELRVRGPNVATHHYHRGRLVPLPMDEHGFLCTGDAAEPADPRVPSAGLVFRGRLAEDFKLATGTFVNVGTVRSRLLDAADGLLSDAVVCGEGRDEVGALAWLHPDHAPRAAGGVPDAALRADLIAILDRMASAGGGTSQRVERLVILDDPADIDAGEITDKGYVNQAVVRRRRAGPVALATGASEHDERVMSRRDRETPPPSR